MKKMLLIVIWASVLILSGCWDRIEINDLAIVTAAAIDNIDNNHTELSIQVFIPRSMSGSEGGGGGTGGGGKTTLVRSGSGVNIADAVSKLQSKIPRKIFWGHCKVYIFGEDMAKSGIAEEMDFLLRHPQPRERARMFVSKEKAVHILELIPSLERNSAEVIRELSDLHIGLFVTIVDLKMMLRGESGSAAVPMVSILPQGKGEEEIQATPYISGTAIFKKDKMIGIISERDTRGIMWMRGETEQYTVTMKTEDVPGFVSLNPLKSDIRLTPQIKDDIWQVKVKVKTEGDIVQNGTNLNLMNPELSRVMEEAFRKGIRTRIENAIGQVQKEMKADIFGFAKEFHRKYPRQWGVVKERWDEVFPQVKVTVDIEVNIRRPGLITVPGGIPENEVKEK